MPAPHFLQSLFLSLGGTTTPFKLTSHFNSSPTSSFSRCPSARKSTKALSFFRRAHHTLPGHPALPCPARRYKVQRGRVPEWQEVGARSCPPQMELPRATTATKNEERRRKNSASSLLCAPTSLSSINLSVANLQKFGHGESLARAPPHSLALHWDPRLAHPTTPVH